MKLRVTETIGLASYPLRALSIALLILLSGGSVFGESASVSHDITIVITPIMIIEVQDYEQATRTPLSDGNGTSTTFTSIYGVTCVAVHGSIQAMLVEPLPEGVTIQVRMKSDIGRSFGWVTLNTGISSILVMDIVGAEFNEIDIALRVPRGVEMDPEGVEIAYLIDSISG